LHHAIAARNADTAKVLIQAGIDYKIYDRNGYTAKMLAEEENIDEILSLFPKDEYKYETPSAYLSYSHFFTCIPISTLSKNSDDCV
jgi:hypothetical protein